MGAVARRGRVFRFGFHSEVRAPETKMRDCAESAVLDARERGVVPTNYFTSTWAQPVLILTSIWPHF